MAVPSLGQNRPQEQQGSFNPALFALSPLAGLANFYPQQTSRFLGGIGNFLFGTPGRTMSTISPEQEEFQKSLLPLLMQLLQGGSPAGFQGIEENARRGFATQTVPTLAERFAGLGGLGSSGYKNTLKEAGTQLESNLAALRGQYAQNQLGQLLGPALTSNKAYIPRTPGLLEGVAGGVGQVLGMGLSGLL